MPHEMYRICDDRLEALGLLKAIGERLGEQKTTVSMNAISTDVSLAYNEDEVVVNLRTSATQDKHQLYIKCSHAGNLARVKAALGRRVTKRLAADRHRRV